MRRILACAVCALTLVVGSAGCFRIGVTTGTEIPERDVRRIVPGVTTKAQILEWFGAPAEATDGEIFARLIDAGEIAAEDLVALPFADYLVYEITDGQGRAVVTLIFNWISVRLQRDRLIVFFDEDHRVLYYGLTRQRGGEGDGTAADADEERYEDAPELDELYREEPGDD